VWIIHDILKFWQQMISHKIRELLISYSQNKKRKTRSSHLLLASIHVLLSPE
jgi:hypothetical protein